jgi:hypothetical protein
MVNNIPPPSLFDSPRNNFRGYLLGSAVHGHGFNKSESNIRDLRKKNMRNTCNSDLDNVSVTK